MSKISTHPVLKNWFTKKGGGKKLLSGSRKRWFVLDDASITYYEKKDEKKAKGNIFVQLIEQVKANGKELVLVTGFRNYTLIAEQSEYVKTWAEGIQERLKDSETIRKVVKKAEKLIKKSAEVEKHSKELCEYIEVLEQENKKLKLENSRLEKVNKQGVE